MKSHMLILALDLWIFATLFIMSLYGIPDYGYYFMICLIGFLALLQISGPFNSMPKWRARANVASIACMAIFAIIVISKIFEIVSML